MIKVNKEVLEQGIKYVQSQEKNTEQCHWRQLLTLNIFYTSFYCFDFEHLMPAGILKIFFVFVK